MATPLQQLRRAIISGDSIDIDKTSVIINNSTRLDRTAKTNFRSFHGRGAEYPLDVVYFQYHFRDLPYNDYFQSCRKQDVQHVIAIDKKDLVGYLTGKVNTCAGIVSDHTANTSSADVANIPAASASAAETGAGASAIATDDEGRLRTSTARLSPVADGDGATGDVGASFASNRLRVRDQRSIDSVLLLKGCDFSMLREKLSAHVSATKKGKPPGEASASQRKSSSQNAGGAVYDPRGDRYTSNEDRFWRENFGSDFHDLGIDMSGSFKAKPTANGTAGPEAGNGPDRSRDRSSEARRPSTKEGSSSKRQKMDPRKAIPIIIVPTDVTSLICSSNAIQLFEKARFMSLEEMRKEKMPIVQPARLTMYRNPGGSCSCAQYDVVTNPNRMVEDEWNQVVAVVCSGSKWQFQSWPIFKNSTFDLFRRVQGFYFHFDDVTPSRDVESWAIKKLTVSREKRHMDGQLHSQFWNGIDTFIARNRLPLRY